MKITLSIVFLALISWHTSGRETAAVDTLNADQCNYLERYQHLGNTKADTFRLGQRLIDPIDDVASFKKADFGFVRSGNKLYKKSTAIRSCGNMLIGVEYYQEFSDRVELASYREYDERFFATKNSVNFWWANSDGQLIIPINGADPDTFEPFQNICGGTDATGVFYGCPNRGVYLLNIPIDSEYEFFAKENNYWNSPHHYVLIDNEGYDIKHEWKKGYFCELDASLSKDEVMKLKNSKC
jgi:hypothetical protein